MVRQMLGIQCNYCPKQFATKESYRSHQKKSHGVKKWACEFCGRCFAERGTLTNHRRTHTKETPFGCETCGRRFSHRATLLNHKKTHNKFRVHGCGHCGKRFHRKSNLNRHVQVMHLGNGGKRAPKRRNLRHMQFRHSAPPMLASDSASDTSPMQGPLDIKMPPPPLPVDMVLRRMGFPQNLTSGHLAAMNLPPAYIHSQGNMPERVTLSVTYEQNQMRRASMSAQPSFQQMPPPVNFPVQPLPNLPVPPRPTAVNGVLSVPPPVQFVPKIEHVVKEEPIDSYSVPAAPPSLEHSRSNSPIIIGNDDLMMKDEVHAPSPLALQSQARLFNHVFNFSKNSDGSVRLPTPIRNGEFMFPAGVKRESIGVPPPGQVLKPPVHKRDSIPDKLKLQLDCFPMPNYLASQMRMTIERPNGSTDNINLSAPSPRTNTV